MLNDKTWKNDFKGTLQLLMSSQGKYSWRQLSKEKFVNICALEYVSEMGHLGERERCCGQ